MKKLLPLLFFFIPLFINAQDYTIENYNVDLEVIADGSFQVKETIDVFFHKKRRGIIRDIENQYKIDNGKVFLDITNINIDRHEYKVSSNKERVSIRIGNPDVYITGDQQYKISYTIKNGIIAYPEHQEFYYDIIGTKWDTDIKNVDFTITLPRSITLEDEDFKVTGGRQNENRNIADMQQVDSRTIKGNSTFPLSKYTGISAAIRLPEKYLEVANNQVTYFESHEEKEYKPWYIALPLAIFGLFVSFWRKMRQSSYMPVENKVRAYPPEGLTSAHVGAFVDQTSNTRDLVSLIPYWAGEGFLEMKQTGDEIYLYRIKNLPAEFPEHEHIIFDRLFEENEIAKISDLKTKFYSSLTKAANSLTKEVKNQEYYNMEYSSTFRSWRLVIFPIAMIAFGLLSLIYFKLLFLAIGFFGAALGGLILPMFRLPLTEKGAILKSEIDDFRHFLKNPDSDVLGRVTSDDPDYFNKMFPFAVAFGMESIFLDKLQPYMHNPPYWYHNTHGDNSYQTFRSSFKPEVIQSAFSSTPQAPSGGSSGGSFSSGGGVGGGGGSSW